MIYAWTLSIVHTCIMIIVHACTVITVHARTTIIVHACTVAMTLVSFLQGLCFSWRWSAGGWGGEAPKVIIVRRSLLVTPVTQLWVVGVFREWAFACPCVLPTSLQDRHLYMLPTLKDEHTRSRPADFMFQNSPNSLSAVGVLAVKKAWWGWKRGCPTIFWDPYRRSCMWPSKTH